MKQLTPADNEAAARWREECWKRIRDRQARPKLPKLREGMVIRFDELIPFRDGSREAEFRIVDPRRMIAVVPGGWSRYKLSRRTIQNRAWQVVNAV